VVSVDVAALSVEMIVKLVGQLSLQQVLCEVVSVDVAALSVEMTSRLVKQVSLQYVTCMLQ